MDLTQFKSVIFNTTTGIKTSSTFDGLADYYVATIVSYSDYDPFGTMQDGRTIPGDGTYRFGFQGQEMDNEIKGRGNSYNYEYRMHDPRLGRFFAVDPLAPKYPHNSPYAFSENRLIDGVELEGLEVVSYQKKDKKTGKYSNQTEKRNATPEEIERLKGQFGIKGTPATNESWRITNIYENGTVVGVGYERWGYVNGKKTKLNQHVQNSNTAVTPPSSNTSSSYSDAVANTGTIVGGVDDAYGYYKEGLNFETYITTKGLTKLIYKKNGEVRSAQAAKQLRLNNRVQLGGLGLNVLNIGLGYADLNNQYKETGTVNVVDATDVGVGTVGTVASGMSYLGYGGAGMSTVGNACGIIGVGFNAGRSWWFFYSTLDDLQWHRTSNMNGGELLYENYKYQQGYTNDTDMFR